jgi:hypothetical protein
MPTLYQFTDAQKEAIISMYPKYGCPTIAREIGAKQDAIKTFLVNSGLYQGYSRRAAVSVDKGFFSWNPDFAYFLGYAYADGCLQHNSPKELDRKPRVVKMFTITSEDKQILEDMKKAMNLKAKIFSYDRYNNTYHRLGTNSSWVYDSLVSFGVSERKSYDGMNVPEVPNEYLRHFARGFIDGDGSIGRRKCFCVRFGASDLKFVQWLHASICHNVSLSHLPAICKEKRSDFFSTTFYGCNGKKVYNWLYPDACQLRLARKWCTPKFIESEIG